LFSLLSRETSKSLGLRRIIEVTLCGRLWAAGHVGFVKKEPASRPALSGSRLPFSISLTFHLGGLLPLLLRIEPLLFPILRSCFTKGLDIDSPQGRPPLPLPSVGKRTLRASISARLLPAPGRSRPNWMTCSLNYFILAERFCPPYQRFHPGSLSLSYVHGKQRDSIPWMLVFFGLFSVGLVEDLEAWPPGRNRRFGMPGRRRPSTTSSRRYAVVSRQEYFSQTCLRARILRIPVSLAEHICDQPAPFS
jgi:hypothetical protein